jgi:hypothetical protein
VPEEFEKCPVEKKEKQNLLPVPFVIHFKRRYVHIKSKETNKDSVVAQSMQSWWAANSFKPSLR